ncbi:MAG: hypothetical protein ABSF51_08255 [Verrucomicrobiota bacterium]|jgi:hypothetical protein
MEELKTPPQDLKNYVKASHFGSLDKDESNLRELIKQGTLNILAERFPFETVKDVEEDTKANGYAVFFIPRSGSTAFADWFSHHCQTTASGRIAFISAKPFKGSHKELCCGS